MTTRRVVIMTDDPGWHGEELRLAFRKHRIETTFVSLSQCRFDLNTPTGVLVPGFVRGLPDGIFVRSVPGGTLEQVVLRLDVLHALKELGVPVYNEARVIERSVDKAMTSFLLKRANIPTPATWVAEQAQVAGSLLLRSSLAGQELVIKPLFGSQGVGLKRLRQVADLPLSGDYQNVFYLQRFIDSGEGNWHDWRVLVVGGTAVAAMIRCGQSWINNVAQGARCEPANLDAELKQLAEAAVAALQMDYGGVDIMRDTQGNAYVIEVNGIPAWKGLQSVCPMNIAQLLADDFVSRRLAQPQNKVVSF